MFLCSYRISCKTEVLCSSCLSKFDKLFDFLIFVQERKKHTSSGPETHTPYLCHNKQDEVSVATKLLNIVKLEL
jgi:hypothetical protein